MILDVILGLNTPRCDQKCDPRCDPGCATSHTFCCSSRGMETEEFLSELETTH